MYSEEDLEEKVRAIVSATTNQSLKLGFRDFCRNPDVTILSGMKVPTKFNKYNGIGDPTHHLTTFVAIAVDLALQDLSFKKESYPVNRRRCKREKVSEKKALQACPLYDP